MTEHNSPITMKGKL